MPGPSSDNTFLCVSSNIVVLIPHQGLFYDVIAHLSKTLYAHLLYRMKATCGQEQSVVNFLNVVSSTQHDK